MDIKDIESRNEIIDILNQLKNFNDKTVKTRKTELITCKEAAKLYPIGEHKFRELCKSRDKKFPSIKVDSRYYIIKNKLDEWLQEQALGKKL